MGKMKEAWSYQEEYNVNGQEIEYEMRLTNFLHMGGYDLGYTRDNCPAMEDWEDVLVNEMKADVYWLLKENEEGVA